MSYGTQREDGKFVVARGLSVVQIVDRKGALCAFVAAGNAIAAVSARVLWHAGNWMLVIFFEVYRQGGPYEFRILTTVILQMLIKLSERR